MILAATMVSLLTLLLPLLLCVKKQKLSIKCPCWAEHKDPEPPRAELKSNGKQRREDLWCNVQLPLDILTFEETSSHNFELLQNVCGKLYHTQNIKKALIKKRKKSSHFLSKNFLFWFRSVSQCVLAMLTCGYFNHTFQTAFTCVQ